MRKAAIYLGLMLYAGIVFYANEAKGIPGLRKHLNQIERLIAEWQITEARQWLQPLLQGAVDNPRVLQLHAEVLFLEGKYQEALIFVHEALQSSQSNVSRLKMLKSLIERTAQTVKGYVEYQSAQGHFRLWAPPGKDEILFPFASQALEQTLQQLQKILKYIPTDSVRVEIYPNPEILAQVSPLTVEEINRSGTIALCKYNRLMIISPRALLRGYAWLDTLAHEYTHLVLGRITRNSLPVWLQEGLAKFFESSWHRNIGKGPPLLPIQEHLLAEALRTGKLITWEQMYPSLAKLPDQRSTTLAFAEAQTAVEFLLEKFKLAKLEQLLKAFHIGKTEGQAFFSVTGITRETFDKEWKEYLKERNLRRHTGLISPELRFGQPLTAEQRIAAVKEVNARRFLRLAEMLRYRKYTRAAILEYQKARTLLGPRDDLVANHLARAYLELSNPTQAISTLLPVLEYYPEVPGPQVSMGIAYLRSGDLTAAERHLKMALSINPFDPEIHCNLATILKGKSAAEAKLHASICHKLGN